MFGFHKKTAPPIRKSNPGVGSEAKIAFANGNRSWTEKIDTVKLAAFALKQLGYSVKNEKTWRLHPDSGFTITPQFVQLQPLDNGGVRTVTTVQVNHPTLTPDGVYEYQHSVGDTAAESISKGFEQWVQTDFVPLLESLQPKPGKCTAMEMELTAEPGKPARVRRAILGPVMHYMQNPPGETETAKEEHSFCPCCLLTRSFEAFKDLLQSDQFYCLRLYAARDEQRVAQADCRVNGDEFEPGKETLRKYAATWPDAGFEFRKQYVVMQTIEKQASFSAAADAGDGAVM